MTVLVSKGEEKTCGTANEWFQKIAALVSWSLASPAFGWLNSALAGSCEAETVRAALLAT